MSTSFEEFKIKVKSWHENNMRNIKNWHDNNMFCLDRRHKKNMTKMHEKLGWSLCSKKEHTVEENSENNENN